MAAGIGPESRLWLNDQTEVTGMDESRLIGISWSFTERFTSITVVLSQTVFNSTIYAAIRSASIQIT